jgi:oligopeptide transport system substrate-binding protein
MKVKSFFVFLACLIIALLVWKMNGKKKATDAFNLESKIARIAINLDPPTLDPRVARDLASQSILKMLFEGISRVGKDGNVEPALASKIEISEDGLEYTFHLKKTSWSNGDLLTAHDFVYTWSKILDPSFPSPYAYQLYVIKNAKPVKNGDLPLDALGIEAIDSYTLSMTLEAPVPYLQQMLATPIFFPVNRKVAESNPDWATRSGKDYVSNGPFVLDQWKQNDMISVRKNNHYWEQNVVDLVGVDLIVSDDNTALQMFEKKELDWVGSPLGTLPTDALPILEKRKEFFKKPSLGVHFFRFNIKKPPFDDVKIRRALNLALDRQELVDHVMMGGQVPALRIVPPCLYSSDLGFFQDADLENARKLFNEALQERGITKEMLPEITLTFASSSVASRNSGLAQAIQQQWRKAFGIVVNLEGVEGKVFFQKIGQQDYQMSMGSWYADVSDPVDFLRVFKFKNGSTNNTGWENDAYIRILDESDQELDAQKREELLFFAEEILMNEMPMAPIYFSSSLHLKSLRLKDVYLSDLQHIDFKWAKIQDRR